MATLNSFLFQDTTATQKVFGLRKRVRAVAGGTSASKTVSILVWLIDYCQSKQQREKLCHVVSESFPHLEMGAMLDFQNIMKDRGYWNEERWHGTLHTYTFETGNKIRFMSVDTYGKAHGPRRDVLFINEANNLEYKIVDQLITRTREIVWMDWNPSEEFYFYTEMKPNRDDIDFITLTYKDNEALDLVTVAEIESHKNNLQWWTVYGLGQLGVIESRIYKDWQIIDEVPFEARLDRYGLDFGYSNDPTAIMAVYYYNGGYILDEICYQKGLLNKAIADILNNQPKAIVIADAAEPKSIEEIRLHGITILPCQKGPGSINRGIGYVQQQRISITKRSVETIKEYRNYNWMIDKEGKIINEPQDFNNHCFAPDTLVRTTNGDRRIADLVGESGHLYSRDGRIEAFKDVRITMKNAEMVIINFDDGSSLSVTPNHLLLLANGQWIEAGLLSPMDKIQSDMYGDTNIQRQRIQTISEREIFQSGEDKTSPNSVGASSWKNPEGNACSPQRSQSKEQPYIKSGVEKTPRTSIGTHDSRSEEKGKRMDQADFAPFEEVAWVSRGNCVAQLSWETGICKKKEDFKILRTLPQGVFHDESFRKREILSSELQNERSSKAVVRITRGFASLTYNLEVENTHCLIANGVVAHNCMDALRYAIASIKDPNQMGARTHYAASAQPIRHTAASPTPTLMPTAPAPIHRQNYAHVHVPKM